MPEYFSGGFAFRFCYVGLDVVGDAEFFFGEWDGLCGGLAGGDGAADEGNEEGFHGFSALFGEAAEADDLGNGKGQCEGLEVLCLKVFEQLDNVGGDFPASVSPMCYSGGGDAKFVGELPAGKFQDGVLNVNEFLVGHGEI